MFYPQEMTEVEILVPENEALDATRVLAGEGILHQVDASYLSAKTGTEAGNDWADKSVAFAELERRILSMMQTLDVGEGMPPSQVSDSVLELEEVRSTVGRLEDELHMMTEELSKTQKKLEQLRSYAQQLEPIAHLDVDLDILRQAQYTFSLLGTMPADRVERLRTSLVRIPFLLLSLHQEGHNATVWLLGTRNDADILERAARSAYLNPFDLPQSYQGTPSQIWATIQDEIKQAQEHITLEEGTLAELHEVRKEQLQGLLWRIRASRMLTEAIARFGKLHYTYLIIGWVPTSRLADLNEQLKRVSDAIFVKATRLGRPGAGQNVPVALHNPGLLSGFEQLTTTYARPRYQELDPTFLIAVTFPLIFGAMFGDVGHGLLLALVGGLLASRRVRSLSGWAGLGAVVAACGLAATVFGFLYGSIFGFEDILPALLFRPLHNIMQILMISVGGGIALLSMGFLISMLNAYRARDWARLLVDHNGLAGLVLYWSLLGLAASALVRAFPLPSGLFTGLVFASALTVMFSEALGRLIEGQRPLVRGSVGMYAVGAFFELFETLISLLSNSLSYVRVGAFAVAHGGLSAVIFILAEMVSRGHGVGYWVVVALGNLFIIGFEGLVVGIQTLRLEYYEFFSKFFTGGGAQYQPLTPVPAHGK
jgi:V/A-type H+-transporting ATPase subunit I